MLALHAGNRNSSNIILTMYLWKKKQRKHREEESEPGGGGQTEKTGMWGRRADAHVWLCEKCPQCLSWWRIIITEMTFLTPQLWPLLWSLRGVVVVVCGWWGAVSQTASFNTAGASNTHARKRACDCNYANSSHIYSAHIQKHTYRLC